MFHDFGPSGVVRDVHAAGNRVAAVVGGRVAFSVDPRVGPTQWDSGGVLHLLRRPPRAPHVLAFALRPGDRATRLLAAARATPGALPELADRRVLTSPTAPLDDTVPAHRPITLRHLLTMGSGYGMEFGDSPLQKAMAHNGTEAGPHPVTLGADESATPAGSPGWPSSRSHSSPERAGATTTRSPCSAFSWLASRVGRSESIWPKTCATRWGCRTPPSGCRRRNSTGYPRRTDLARAVSWRWSRRVAASMPGRRPSM